VRKQPFSEFAALPSKKGVDFLGKFVSVDKPGRIWYQYQYNIMIFLIIRQKPTFIIFSAKLAFPTASRRRCGPQNICRRLTKMIFKYFNTLYGCQTG
jgi:hypothetical protein